MQGGVLEGAGQLARTRYISDKVSDRLGGKRTFFRPNLPSTINKEVMTSSLSKGMKYSNSFLFKKKLGVFIKYNLIHTVLGRGTTHPKGFYRSLLPVAAVQCARRHRV